MLVESLMCSPVQSSKEVKPSHTCLLGPRDFYLTEIDFSELKKKKLTNTIKQFQIDDFISFLELKLY